MQNKSQDIIQSLEGVTFAPILAAAESEYLCQVSSLWAGSWVVYSSSARNLRDEKDH